MIRAAHIAVLSLVLLSACASVSREECIEGDWEAIGARDGAAGRMAETQFERHINACARVDITPDRAVWMRGYEAGLARYCTPETGLREGEAGRPYRDVCPSARETGFLLGHDLGLSAHRQRQRIAEIEREISALTRRNFVLANQSDDDAVHRERRFNQAEISSLRLELGFARAGLLRIEREIRAFRATL